MDIILGSIVATIITYLLFNKGVANSATPSVISRKYPDGTLLKASGGEVDIMQSGVRRWIPDPNTFNAMGLNWNNIKTISDAEWNTIPVGPTLPAITPALIAPHLISGATLLTDNAIATAESQKNFNSGDRARFIRECLPMLSAEQITAPSGTHCASGFKYGGPPLTITALKGGTLALSSAGTIGGALGGTFGSVSGFAGTGFAASGTALGTAIPIIGIALGAAISIFSSIAAHHAAAVKNEQGLECTNIPPANYSLEVIEQAVTSGTITTQQGIAALDKLHSDFVSASTNGTSGQLTDKPGKVNAMGWYSHFLQAIITKKQNRYAHLSA